MNVFSPTPASHLLDATVGHGGHTRAYLEGTSADSTAVGLDADREALKMAAENLAEFGNRVQLVCANFANMKDSLLGGGILPHPPTGGSPPLFHHILFDLGIGSHQLADPNRGFSFASGAELGMAYGELAALPPAKVAALNALQNHRGYLPDVSDILSGLTAADLAEVIRFYGEERYAERIARALKQSLPISSAKELAHLITDAVPGSYEHGRIHPATRTFQALRIATNRELEALEVALPQALDLLLPQGVLAVISFHSLEDRIVKNFVRQHKDALEILTKKPTRAGQAEIQRNPRSRSAKLRAARKT